MPDTMKYISRFYRNWVENELVSFEVKVEETDLFILAEIDLTKETEKLIIEYRIYITEYIKERPDFKTSLIPIKYDEEAPDIVRSMLRASEKANVGPMAAVAGAIAEFIGYELLNFTEEIIIENGGDIFIKSLEDRNFAIFAGNSPLSGKINIKIKSIDTPLGVCTSSGTVSHSLSFGKADAVTILAKDASLADAAATRVCNEVKSKDDIEKALNLSKTIEGVMGCVIIFGDRIGSVGSIELL